MIQKSLGQYCNIHIFLSFLGSLLKQRIIFEIFLQVSLPPPYIKLKRGRKFWIHASNIVMGGVGPVWIGKRRRKCKSVPRLLSMIVGKRTVTFFACNSVWLKNTPMFLRMICFVSLRDEMLSFYDTKRELLIAINILKRNRWSCRTRGRTKKWKHINED